MRSVAAFITLCLATPSLALDLMPVDCTDANGTDYYLLRNVAPSVMSALVEFEDDGEQGVQSMFFLDCESGELVHSTNRLAVTGLDWPKMREAAEQFFWESTTGELKQLATSLTAQNFPAKRMSFDTAICGCLQEKY